MKERALAAESYLSSLEQELQLHKEIAAQLQVAPFRTFGLVCCSWQISNAPRSKSFRWKRGEEKG